MILIVCFIACAYMGIIVGGHLRDAVWMDKANGPSRMLCGGKFFRVTLDADPQEEQ